MVPVNPDVYINHAQQDSNNSIYNSNDYKLSFGLVLKSQMQGWGNNQYWGIGSRDRFTTLRGRVGG